MVYKRAEAVEVVEWITCVQDEMALDDLDRIGSREDLPEMPHGDVRNRAFSRSL